nr:hypothetical protein [Tanacetum cinerariifolium]GEV43989.1 hypothetical protein [Tanacetum cinerariifolium]
MNDSMIELRETFQARLQKQVVNLDSYTPEPSQGRKIPIYYDDDDEEESSTPLRDIIISKLPLCIAITPILSIEEPKDSLIIGDEHLDTIPEKESDEFIKSSVENLVSSPSESKDISDGECDFHLCDDFPKSHLVTFSNPLFDIDNDFTSSNDESFSGEDVPMENFKIFSNPLFDLYEEIISTEVNLIQNEVLESITLIPPGINEADFDPEGGISLIERLLYVENSIESFPHLISPDYSNYEEDNLFQERFLNDDPVTLPDIFYFSNAVRVFLPFFTYLVTSSIFFSSGSEDTIFDPGISNYHFSSLESGVSHRSGTFMKFNVYPNHLNESPMEVLSSICFPMDQ